MSLQICTDPSFWKGVIPAGPVAGESAEAITASNPCQVFFDWFPYCNPSLNQNGDSCVGWGWSHWLTGMIKRFADSSAFSAGWQLNGNAIWVRGREMYWAGDMNGGLYLPQGLAAMRDLGIVPYETKVAPVANDWDSVGKALLDTPVVQGHAIHKGWFTASHENGCLDHEPMASGSNGYHCTLRIARLMQDDVRFYVLQNSWGSDWAFYGYGMMTDKEDREGLMDGGLYTAIMPQNWTSWNGWEKLLIKA